MSNLHADPAPHTGRLAHLLQSYTSSHPLRSPSPLPAGSRFTGHTTQRSAPPTSASPLLWTLPTWIAFVQFTLAKGLHIVWSLIRHILFGPLRPSWGYRMTYITSFMRNVANYTDFADIVLLRRLISITYFIPLPADAVVTPITFLVPKRRLADACRGFLHEWDVQETGTRELTGEWVVGNDVWKRLKSERRARWHGEMRRRAPHGPSRLRDNNNSHNNPSSSTSSPATSTKLLERGRSTPELELEADGAALTGRRERVIYFVHGGAYYVGNAATHRLITIGISKACNARVFAITYRLAPEFAFPLPLLDVVQGYLRLLAAPLSIPPGNIIVMGDSAGGGMSLALMMYLRDNNYPMPAGACLLSPWVDLTMSCGSWDENGPYDVINIPVADDHLNPVGCYLGPKGLGMYLTHPYASPLFGDMSNLPPLLIQSGDSEVLRDEITLLAHKATLAGVPVTHELYEDMVHVFQMFTWLPATHAAINSIGRWVRQTLPRIEWEQRQFAEMEAVAEENDQWAGEHGAPADGEATLRPPSPSPGAVTADAAGQAPTPSATLASIGLSNLTGDGTPRSGATSITSIDVDSLPPGATVAPPPSTNPQRTVSSQQLAELRTSSTQHLAELHGDAGFHSPSLRPSLRRANTTSPMHSAAHTPVSPVGGLPSSPRVTLRRRRTYANLAMHMASSPVSPAGGLPGTGPVSPSPSMRRLRAPSVGSHPTTPSTRTRSHSHSDIFHLVEGYLEAGAANATVLYTPGGEIRSVGVLGDESDDDYPDE